MKLCFVFKIMLSYKKPLLTNTHQGYIINLILYPHWVYDVIKGVLFHMDNEFTDNMPECCTGKHKDRSIAEKRDLMNRLKRIEGQVRGVQGMLENDSYCIDILVQVSAITAALNSFNKVLLANHLKTCVADNIKNGNDEVIDELVKAMQKLMK